MNKSELIEAISQDIASPLKETGAILNTILDSMTESLANGDNIEIRGFGSFMVKQYGTYYGRNPKTGEKIEVKPKKLPFFKVGKELKESVDCS